MRKLLPIIMFALALPTLAHASLILDFGQIGTANTITATTNAGNTQTTITGTLVPVTITQIINDIPAAPFTAEFSITATSVGNAVSILGNDAQAFNGSFSFTNGGATNYLSGTFSDAVFGSGTGLTLTASDANVGESVTFTSSVIPASDLLPPQSVNLSFADVSPGVGIVGTTIAPFTAAVSGDFSATAAPEPTTLAILGVSLLGLGLVRARRFNG